MTTECRCDLRWRRLAQPCERNTPYLGGCERCKVILPSIIAGVSDPGGGKVFQKLRIWRELRKLEQDRAFLLKNENDPRSQELLPLVEEEIANLRACQIKLRYPNVFQRRRPKAKRTGILPWRF